VLSYQLTDIQQLGVQTGFSAKQRNGTGIQDLLPQAKAACKILERFHASSFAVAKANAALTRNIAGIRYHEIQSIK
jgi:hypothetical protein